MTKTGSFEFYDNYAESAQKLQPELYYEINKILNNEFTLFFKTFNRKPIILDIGSAGLLPYDVSLIEKCVLFDLFKKPEGLQLYLNCEWITGDILSDEFPSEILKIGKFDFIIMSSLLHHLCNENNEIIKNLETCFYHSGLLLSDIGKICIFESTCPKFLTKIEDFCYPVYSRILLKVLKLAFVRMVTMDEILLSMKKMGLKTKVIPFRQPRYIAQMYWRVPTKFYPLKINAIFAYHNPMKN
jgi:SAM-dependent methyltransferase